ncbi:MAG: hypothetical protein ACOC4G_09380, partial [Bacillota bacterium]
QRKSMEYCLSDQYNEIKKEEGDNIKQTINKADKDDMDRQNFKNIEDKLDAIEKENIAIKKDAEAITKYVLPAVIGVGAILLAAIIFGYDSMSTKVESQFNQINTSINKNMDLINQKLDSQKEINSLQIQRDVKEEVLKQFKK